MKTKISKTKWLPYTAIIIILFIAVFMLLGEYGIPYRYFNNKPLFEDTNVSKIRINQTIKQGNLEIELKRLEAGEEYSVLIYDSSYENVMITDAKLFQNDKELNYISTATGTYQGGAIAFEPVEGLENIELRIYSKEAAYDDKAIVIPIS